MRQLLIATGNRHKLDEIRAVLAPHDLEILGGGDVGGIPAVVEDGTSFKENAVKKALETAHATGRWVLADDSGLEAMVLDGAPGILSARYAGEGASDAQNLEKLLRKMDGVDDRRAQFVCVMAVAGPDGVLGTVRGTVPGRLLDKGRGSGGFGYDPIFVPDGYETTFAEMSAAVKNSISHRFRALQAAIHSGLLEQIPGNADGSDRIAVEEQLEP